MRISNKTIMYYFFQFPDHIWGVPKCIHLGLDRQLNLDYFKKDAP